MGEGAVRGGGGKGKSSCMYAYFDILHGSFIKENFSLHSI